MLFYKKGRIDQPKEVIESLKKGTVIVDNTWKKLETLRVTDRNYSGLHYSYEYAKKHKDLKAISGGCYSALGKPVTVGIEELIELKEDKSGEILYRVIGKDTSAKNQQEFHTQYGTYISDDQGEFGGSLITPAGKTVNGNFRYMFDLKDKVYGIDTGAHLMIAHFVLLCFSDSNQYQYLYSVGGISQRVINHIENKGITEDFCCVAIEVKEDKAFLLLSGYVTKEEANGERRWWKEIRVLKIEAEVVDEVVCITGDLPNNIKSVIVQEDTVYISCDKMVIKYHLLSKKFTYFTCLTEEDENNLLENERKQ